MPGLRKKTSHEIAGSHQQRHWDLGQVLRGLASCQSARKGVVVVVVVVASQIPQALQR